MPLWEMPFTSAEEPGLSMCEGTVRIKVNTSQDNSLVAIERGAKVIVRELFVAYWLFHTETVKRPAADGHEEPRRRGTLGDGWRSNHRSATINGPPMRRVPA
jgi:hypothetical protein